MYVYLLFLAMLPVLENAQQTAMAMKLLETENSQLKSVIEQHDVDAKNHGNAVYVLCSQCRSNFILFY